VPRHSPIGRWRDQDEEIQMLDDNAPHDGWSKWAWGVTLPVIVGLIALRVAVTQSAAWPGRGGWANIEGTAAQGVALALLGMALFWHAHYFWLLSPRMHAAAQIGKVLSVVCIAAGLGTMLWLEFRLF
jgi:hypothetical protein